MTPFPGAFSSTRGRRSVLTAEQREWFVRWFPFTTNARLTEATGMSEHVIHVFAREFGLKKDEKYIRKILRKAAQESKKRLEANGYYDSLRGKPLSEATREGIRRWWKDVHDGKRLGPIETFRKRHPRKFREMLRVKSEQRKETIRRERARLRWGLEQKTRLTIVRAQKYTRCQLSKRHYAKKRGYILADTCAEGSGHRYVIYYNEATVRSAVFERNCVREGFRIKELTL